MAFSFGLREAGTTVRTEVLAGLTTWLAMVYIVAVNPGILATTGMDHGALFVATCLGAGIATIAMGLYANYPLALAPGMGLNAYFAFVVVGSMKIPWQVALGAVFLSGVLFLIVSLLRVREWLINTIPLSLKLGIGAGIGFFSRSSASRTWASWWLTPPPWSPSATSTAPARCWPARASSSWRR